MIPATTIDPKTGEPIVRMYISNISPLATQEEVEELVGRVVNAKRIHTVRNMRHGLCARFAFVDVDPADEKVFRETLDGARFLGRTIGVLRVMLRPDRSGPDGV